MVVEIVRLVILTSTKCADVDKMPFNTASHLGRFSLLLLPNPLSAMRSAVDQWLNVRHGIEGSLV